MSPHAGKIPPFQHLHPHPNAKTLHVLPEAPARPTRFLEQPSFLPKIRILIIFLGSSAVKDLFSLGDRYSSVSSGIHHRSGTKKCRNKPRLWIFPSIILGSKPAEVRGALITSRCINYAGMASGELFGWNSMPEEGLDLFKSLPAGSNSWG